MRTRLRDSKVYSELCGFSWGKGNRGYFPSLAHLGCHLSQLSDRDGNLKEIFKLLQVI